MDDEGNPGMGTITQFCTSTYNYSTGMWTGTFGLEFSGCGNSGGGSDDYESQFPCFSCDLGEGENDPELLEEEEIEVEYSNESPACDLEFPEYPAWPDEHDEEWGGFEQGQSDSCFAVRDYAENGSKMERKVKYRFKHAPTGTCYLKVWYEEVFTPEATDEEPDPEPVITTKTPYVWSGSGNPCLAENEKAFNHEDNEIFGDETEMTASANGTKTVRIVKYSCLEGYEPDVSDEENPQPNGFPDPAWEAAA